ncbi:MAG TPA: GMC family oxidoreductase [Steroidobacteraceae bacterium]|nr:GMC family oxidoreductase [Steroidobacteraceae bacterium]
MISRLNGAGVMGPVVWDLCIVGAGAAGLSLAAEFFDKSLRILILESGLHEPDADGDDLNRMVAIGLPHDGWREGRIRALGGTTRAWGGQLVPLRHSEVQPRSWVPDSGWPLDLAELQPYYRRAEELLGTQGPPYDESAFPHLGVAPLAFDPDQFQIRLSQWAALGKRNFAVLWRRELERSKNITVLLDATVIGIRCAPSGGLCESLEVKSRSGDTAQIRARTFVMACGGIETARLLLASKVANGSGKVGRYFQDHVSYVAGEVEPVSRKAVQSFFDPRYIGSTMFSVKVEPTAQAMRQQGWLNAMAHIAFEIPNALGWMEVRRLLRSVQAGKPAWPAWDESKAMLRGGAELTRLVLTRYLARRRRSPDHGGIKLLVDAEQAPNAASQIVLDTEVDAFGTPRARLDWRIGDLELNTLTGFSRAIAREFERLGLGRITLARGPDFAIRNTLGAARDIFHHMGTARMSRKPEDGVTRTDLRCHDVDNLYIAGAAVFPSGGIANPTFTAIALSLRLADQFASSRVLSA